jgi:hypothetical protein
MNKVSAQHIIKFLAYFHRYGWIVAMIIIIEITDSLYCFGIILIIYSLWTMIGYLLKWKHIYCSYQNAYHKQMTPNNINWTSIRKSDVYVVAGFLFVGGLIILHFTN